MNPWMCFLMGFGFLATAVTIIAGLIRLAIYLQERIAWFGKALQIAMAIIVIVGCSWLYGFLICDTWFKGSR